VVVTIVTTTPPPSVLFKIVAFFLVQYVYALFNVVTINSEYFPKQHELGLVTPGLRNFKV